MRFALRSLVLAGAVAFGGAVAPPDPLAALAAANGHAASLHLHATGKRVVEGRAVVTTVDQLGTQRLARRCVNEVCGGTYFDGTREWTFGINDVALPEEIGEETLAQRTLFAIVSYAFAEPAFRAAGGTVARDGAGRWRVRARDGAELVATIDPATSAVRRVDTPGGQPVALYARIARAGSASYALDRAGAFENGPLDDVSVQPGPVGPPAGIATTVGPDAPLALGGEGIPIVPCTLGGRSVRCLLDSGATPSAITLTLAEALGLEPHGELEIAGLGRFATGFVEAGPLALGSARMERARYAVVPRSNAARFDVVVGSDLLAGVRLVLDRRRGTARLLAPGGSPAAGGIALTFRSGSPMIAATLGGQAERALLDTGDQSIVSLGYAEYRNGPQWAVLSRGQVFGVGGGDDAFTVQVPAVQVGALSLGPTVAAVRRTQTTPHVGIGIWERYVVDLDEAAGRVSFSPR